jgi:ABC-type phosphate transport system permease subunit
MEEQLDVMTEETLGRSNESWHGEELAASARCVYCGEGMAHNVLPRFNRGYGIVVLIVGLLLSMFLSLLLGLPMVVIGAYMGAANRAVWTCRACGAVVDRIGT